MNAALTILMVVIAFAAGHFNGWVSAHVTVARECDRLGGFYVGKRTFRCQADPITEAQDSRP